MLTLNKSTAAPESTENSRSRKEVAAERTRQGLAWFSSFRKTRPFWGGLWMVVGGWLILRLSAVSFAAATSAGITGFGGYMVGGGLIICGFLVWGTPTQRYVAGIIGLLLAIASLIVSNLGGFFIGMFFGIIGSAMTLSWGPKKPRRQATDEASSTEDLSPDPELSEGARA